MFGKIMRRLPFVHDRLPSLSMLAARDQWKHLGAWFRSRQANYLLDHAIPWITYDAAAYLRANVRRGSRVFEYGSGSSTLFWASCDADCTAVEHDADWYGFVKQRIGANSRIDLRLIAADDPPVAQSTNDLADPAAYLSDWVNLAGSTFRNYVTQIDPFPDKSFDIILIDGQARPSCILHSYRKVKPGGMLILDNADVPRYLEQAHKYLTEFECLSFPGIAPIEGVLSQTNIYIAPPARSN